MTSGIYRDILILLVISMLVGCGRKSVPLDKDQFTALLIDMHRADGALAVNRSVENFNEGKNYTYYNDVFRKYGVTRAEFDSCMYYYSAQKVLFSKMYDVIIDSLSKELTALDKILNELKVNDTVNYFPVADTLRLDSTVVIQVDSVVPGLYKFNTTVRFDSMLRERNGWIRSYFISEDGADTLQVNDIRVPIDSLKRTYSWSQYVDSVYSRLEIHYMDLKAPVEKPRPLPKNLRIEKKKKNKERAKKEKPLVLKDLGGEAWSNQLFHPYISRSTERQLKTSLGHHRKYKAEARKR